MRSEEFFNILDDIDDRIVSEIYEDVQRPQKLVAVHRSPNRLPKILLGSAACLAVIAAAGLAARFAVPSVLPVLSGTSETSEATESVPTESETTASLDNSGSVTSESLVDWFSQPHKNPWRRTDTGEENTNTWALEFEHEIFVDSDTDWSPEDYEIISSDNGTVVFAGKISDIYGSGIIIKHAENAYVAYGGLDPETVTVSTGDTVTEGDTLAHPKAFSCLDLGAIVKIKTSSQPITEEFFKSDCDSNCQNIQDLVTRLDRNDHGLPASDGYHHIKGSTGDRVKALEDGVIFYSGTANDGSGMIVMNYNNCAVFIYKGLGTTFPDYYVEDNFNKAVAGETIGYVGDSGDAYWFVLSPIEFGKFAEENGIDFYPTHITFKNTMVHKP